MTSGAAGYLGMFTDATDLGNSAMYQYGTRIGLNTTLPYDYMHVVFNDGSGAFTGYAVQNVNAAGFSGMLFYDQNGSLAQFQGLGNTRHEYRINNIASGGTINFLIGSSSKFYVANSGNIGIGTKAPGYALDVAGDVNLSGAIRWQGTPVLQLSGSGIFGPSNTAVGYDSLALDTTGQYNTAAGELAMNQNNGGSQNTAVGYQALRYNSGGSNNIAIGSNAGINVAPGNNNIHIGSQGALGDNGTIRIGTPGMQTSFYIAGVNGVTTTNSAVPVLIDTTNGQLGVMSSSRRYKEDIQDMGDTSRGLMQLRPVTFRYQKPFDDGSKPIQYGLIAEEVADVYPDLVARSVDGQIETVKYQVLDSMLLNEVQRQQKRID